MNVKKTILTIVLLVIASIADIPLSAELDNRERHNRVQAKEDSLVSDYIDSLVEDARRSIFDSDRINIANKIADKAVMSIDKQERRQAYYALKEIKNQMVFASSKSDVQDLIDELI